MSWTSKIVLGGACAFTVSIVTYVHTKQKRDRESLREGVIRDVHRQEMKKLQNVKMLQDQIELTKVLEAQRKEHIEKAEVASKDTLTQTR